MTALPEPRTTSSRAEIEALLRAAELLHAYGTPAHRLERVVVEIARGFGLDVQVFSTPTSMMLAFGRGALQRTHMLRVEPGEVDLGKLVDLDELLERVEDGSLDANAALAALESLHDAPARWAGAWSVLGFGVASGTAARFFGGGMAEVLVSLAVGVVIGLLERVSRREPGVASLFEPLAAFIAALAGSAMVRLGVAVDDRIVALAGVIVLVPGLTLTVAMIELATRHLASGTARLAGACAVFLTIALGAMLGRVTGEALFGALEHPAATVLPAWTLAPALLLAPLGFALLFRARANEFGWIVASGVTGFLVARAGAAWLDDPAPGSFLGALAVGLFANAYARMRDRPSTVPMLPGILMLVPGALGYRALDAFASREVLVGVETAFLMVLVAISLVGGLLTANAVLPPRRVL